jgi:uncharacterized protein YigE (DUF2233 family)
MNAGMFHRDLSPVGLFVSDARQLTPLNTTNGYGNFYLKPNGVFLLSDTGAQVVESSEYPALHERVILATQSGPLLVHRGKIHPAFNTDSVSRLRHLLSRRSEMSGRPVPGRRHIKSPRNRTQTERRENRSRAHPRRR